MIPLPFPLIHCHGLIVQDVLSPLKPGRCQLMAIFRKRSSQLSLKATLSQMSQCWLFVIQNVLSPANFIATLNRGLTLLPLPRVTSRPRCLIGLRIQWTSTSFFNTPRAARKVTLTTLPFLLLESFKTTHLASRLLSSSPLHFWIDWPQVPSLYGKKLERYNRHTW